MAKRTQCELYLFKCNSCGHYFESITSDVKTCEKCDSKNIQYLEAYEDE